VTVNTLYFNEGGSPRELCDDCSRRHPEAWPGKQSNRSQFNHITAIMPNLVRCPRDDARILYMMIVIYWKHQAHRAWRQDNAL